MNRRQVQPEQSHKGASREQIERAGVAANELVEIDGYQAVILPDRERGGFTGLFFDLAGVIDFHGQDMDSAERDGAETLRVLLEYCTKEGKEHRRATPLDWSDLEIPYNQSWDEEEKIRRREHQRGSLLGCLRARLWKIPPPPPDDDLHPVLVGMLRSGAKEPDYSRHIIHYQNGKMVSDGETNAVTPYQHSQGFAEIELTPEDRAGNLAVVKVNRKAKAEEAKRVASLPRARATRTKESGEKDQEVLVAARSILDPLTKPVSMNNLARMVAENLGEGWTRKGVAPRLERVRGSLPQSKIQPSQNRSRD